MDVFFHHTISCFFLLSHSLIVPKGTDYTNIFGKKKNNSNKNKNSFSDFINAPALRHLYHKELLETEHYYDKDSPLFSKIKLYFKVSINIKNTVPITVTLYYKIYLSNKD